jgi:tRNA-dihydrouridine synthase 3
MGLLEVLPQQMNQRPPAFMCGRSDLKLSFSRTKAQIGSKITEMLLVQSPTIFHFELKHKTIRMYLRRDKTINPLPFNS